MPSDTKFDPFKPQQPRIPGVPEHVEKPKAAEPAEELAPPASFPEPSSRAPLGKIALSLAGVVIIGAGILWLTRTPSRESGTPEAPRTDLPDSAPASNPKAESGPVAPGVVATTAEIAKVWSSKRFLFRNPITGTPEPAMVVHLPDGTYWGLSLREPFGDCDLEYVTNLATLQATYNFHATHPMVTDPCTHAVFDLTRYGTEPDGSLVRGELEQGGAVRPPMAIEIAVHDGEVSATRME